MVPDWGLSGHTAFPCQPSGGECSVLGSTLGGSRSEHPLGKLPWARGGPWSRQAPSELLSPPGPSPAPQSISRDRQHSSPWARQTSASAPGLINLLPPPSPCTRHFLPATATAPGPGRRRRSLAKASAGASVSVMPVAVVVMVQSGCQRENPCQLCPLAPRQASLAPRQAPLPWQTPIWWLFQVGQPELPCKVGAPGRFFPAPVRP